MFALLSWPLPPLWRSWISTEYQFHLSSFLLDDVRNDAVGRIHDANWAPSGMQRQVRRATVKKAQSELCLSAVGIDIAHFDIQRVLRIRFGSLCHQRHLKNKVPTSFQYPHRSHSRAVRRVRSGWQDSGSPLWKNVSKPSTLVRRRHGEAHGTRAGPPVRGMCESVPVKYQPPALYRRI